MWWVNLGNTSVILDNNISNISCITYMVAVRDNPLLSYPFTPCLLSPLQVFVNDFDMLSKTLEAGGGG